jgi:hypothetical protein
MDLSKKRTKLMVFIVSFSWLRHGQSHPVHGCRIKPGISSYVSGSFYNQPDGSQQAANP